MCPLLPTHYPQELYPVNPTNVNVFNREPYFSPYAGGPGLPATGAVGELSCEAQPKGTIAGQLDVEHPFVHNAWMYASLHVDERVKPVGRCIETKTMHGFSSERPGSCAVGWPTQSLSSAA